MVFEVSDGLEKLCVWEVFRKQMLYRVEKGSCTRELMG